MKKSEQTITEIKALMTPRLRKLGPVRTRDAWDICKMHYRGYNTICTAFKIIMLEMIANDQADFIQNGLYFIHKPITKQV